MFIQNLCWLFFDSGEQMPSEHVMSVFMKNLVKKKANCVPEYFAVINMLIYLTKQNFVSTFSLFTSGSEPRQQLRKSETGVSKLSLLVFNQNNFESSQGPSV